MKGVVKNNGRVAGFIERIDSEYIFTYDHAYYHDPTAQAISVTIPKDKLLHKSDRLHPFFLGLLAEGVNKKMQCIELGIDENDDFTRLVKTGRYTVGAIYVEEL